MNAEQSRSDSDPEDKRKHLEFIQIIITRMASASSSTKSWLLPVVTAAYGFAFTQYSGSVALVGIVAVALLAYMDAHYLQQERDYRCLYNTVAADDTNVPINSLNPADRNDNCCSSCRLIGSKNPSKHQNVPKKRISHLLQKWTLRRDVWLSWSIAPFYGTLLTLGVVALIRGIMNS